jgi:hypothetical protein
MRAPALPIAALAACSRGLLLLLGGVVWPSVWLVIFSFFYFIHTYHKEMSSRSFK